MPFSSFNKPPFFNNSPNRDNANRPNAYYGSAAGRTFKAILRKTADLIWPPRSLLSEALVERQGTIEFEKWQELNFISGSKCSCCGIPLEDSFAPDVLCAACIAEKPIFDSARAPLIYDEYSKPLILALKHAGRKDGAKLMANLMKEASFDFENIDLIIPVPLHWTRLFSRGFNQSAWLSQELSKLMQKPWCPDTLVRRRKTESQNGKSFIGRRRNMGGAFATKKPIMGKNILLIDDVFTTGATVRACARTLKRAGANRVDVLTLLRVNRPRSIELDKEPIIDGLIEIAESKNQNE